jgi:hypothetical protein
MTKLPKISGVKRNTYQEIDSGYETPTDQPVKIPREITWAPKINRDKNQLNGINTTNLTFPKI